MPPPQAARIGRLKESGKGKSRIPAGEGISARDKCEWSELGFSMPPPWAALELQI